MARHLKTSAKGENTNPHEFARVKSSEDANRVQMAFKYHSEKHISLSPPTFEDQLAHQTPIGVREAEYLIRTGRTLQ